MKSKKEETIKKSASRNIRFIQAAISIVTSTHLNPYSCKFSKKIYTQHQLLVLILFKDYRNQHYREFIEDVGDMAEVQESLDLSEVPHFTTLQKFISRIKTLYLRFTFKKTVNLFYSYDDIIPITAIDSSGFTSGYCSHYFSERTGKIRKHFLKTSISVDTEQQVITGFVASNSRVHDTRHAVKLLRQCHKINVTKSENPIVTLWIKDTTLNLFIDRSEMTFMPIPLFLSAPGITRLLGVLTVWKWLNSLMTRFILEDKS